ncbi:protein HEG [Epinephelus moara]|uniref:protein HEG n=1 Tax=Epinephelus moara TaxID=300413 RepID=UPI00214E267F|nr:protein HEG [Epinephelus moara]
METWFLNHVLGVSLSVLLLGLPGPLGAGTPSNNSTDPVTAGFYHSDELSNLENNATSTSYSSESLSPSQRNILLTHTAAADLDTEQTQTFTETSSRSLETTRLSTEPLTSTLVVATTEASSSSSVSSSSSTSSGSVSSSSSSSTSSGSVSSSSTSSSSTGSSSGSVSSSSSSTGSSASSSSSSSGSSSGSSTGSSSVSSSSVSSSSSSNSNSVSSNSVSSSSVSSSSSNSVSSSSTDWKDLTNTDQAPGASPAVSREASSWMLTEEARLPQDSPDTSLRLGDTSALTSHTAVHTDSTYTSITITKAGERTLLSVTSSSNNSTSSAFTEDSSSHQPPSTWGTSSRATETEDYTHSAPSTRTDSGDTTDQHMTHSYKGIPQETGSTGGPRGTQSLTGQPNATHHQYTSTSEETSDSTPPLRVTEPSTDQSEVSVSFTPPVTSPTEGLTNISGTEQGSGSSVGTSTESVSTRSHHSSTQEGTEGVSSQTRDQSVSLGLTTASPTVSSSTSGVDNSLTDTPVLVTEDFLTTTPVTVTERSHITEEDTFKATASTPTTTTTTHTITPSPPATSFPRFSSTATSSTPEPPTEATIPYTTPSTTASTLALLTSAAHPTLHVSPSQTQGPSTGMVIPTKATTMPIETSTRTSGITTAHRRRITTTVTHSTPTKSTEAVQTTRKQTDRGTTELVGTTAPTKAPPPPRNPCVSNPCMNGGMCVSYKGHEYTCRCQQAWTGPNCSQDVDECDSDPCPVGSRCVNTRGSFSCECPLGFDLEDGRTCTRAKAFLGTFSVNRQQHDPVIFKSATMHEIQREIIQLLNVSLSVLRGYSRSTLSKKEEDGIHILAVNMFSISTDVTSDEVYNNIQMSLSNCSSSMTHCRMVLHHQLSYHVESLCVAQKTQCDTERSTCTDSSGTAHCQCLQGYYKHNPDDLSCLECGDGYKLENGTCVPCMFGFGGFNCGNFYKLIAVVVSPAGGALVLILIIALIVTCCKKDKNDINKIIFKSGDLQMSPYADFPKNNRISTEWGRETIEMQENGSTKNLLQMTDIYYSPALRNSDLERNGLYPFTGLPGSRHSCIYPAQWNPSFISDDSRRRDYF